MPRPLLRRDTDTFDQKRDADTTKEKKHLSSSLPLPVLAGHYPGAAAPKQARFRKDPRSPHDVQHKLPIWRRLANRVVSRFVSASTGSPSDGLGNVEGSESSASVTRFLASQRDGLVNEVAESEDWETDEVVVRGDVNGLAAAAWRATGGTQTGTETAGAVSSASSVRANSIGSIGMTRRDHADGAPVNPVWHILRWRVWPYIGDFFYPRFESEEKEDEFAKSRWYSQKRAGAFLTVYLVINWALYLIGNHCHTIYEKVVYYGPFTLFTLATPFLVAFDAPRRCPNFFQFWFVAASFYCGWTETIQIKICGFYASGQGNAEACGGKDFLALLYYSTALPALALSTIGARFPFLVGQIVELVLLFVFLIPQQPTFARNVVNFIIFSMFTLWLSYSNEMQQRHAFILNSSLKHAYRAQQKLQLAESAAQNSKRKLTSYIFHEVRVPLNTARLAFQNLQASSAFKEDRLDTNATEIHALDGSLQMMGQVLDDVLDLQRLDSGRFEASYIPFPLHRAINALLGTIRVATKAKRLDFVAEMDPRIDELVQLLPDYADKGLKDLWVVGDELRLRQVISNLASNAVKFTPEGNGRIRVKTELLAPLPADSDQAPTGSPAEQLPPDAVVFRFEVQDGGPGIRPSDLANARLFTPFHQTVASRLSTTKGSGLGLALVKQIITLSGGRLGVQSKKGEGATLWFELGLRIATPEEVEQERGGSHGPLPTPPALPEYESRLAKSILAAATHSTTPVRNSTESSRLSVPGLSSSVPSASSPKMSIVSEEIESSRPLLTSHNTAPSSALRLSGPPPATLFAPNTTPLRVLVVDDDSLTRTLMARMLTRLGCEVETVEDGQAFLDITLGSSDANLPRRYFDAVTLDNHMEPGMSGEHAIRLFRAAGRDDLVIGCTGNALKEDQRSYIEAGVNRVLTKPLLQRDLKAMLVDAEARRARDVRGPTQNDEISVVSG